MVAVGSNFTFSLCVCVLIKLTHNNLSLDSFSRSAPQICLSICVTSRLFYLKYIDFKDFRLNLKKQQIIELFNFSLSLSSISCVLSKVKLKHDDLRLII